MTRWYGPIRLLFLLVLVAAPAQAERPADWAVATAHPLATEAGETVLRAGGNAFDAAVAVSAALAVVEPFGSGMGGGGFWLLHEADTGSDIMIDGRERAPLAATPDMYLDDEGQVVRERSMEGPLAAGIPGQPAALVHIAETRGALPLAESLAPAIHLARTGFPVDARYAARAGFREELLQSWPETAALFLDEGEAPEEGWMLRQPDLADTIERIAQAGRSGFYEGPVADALLAAVRDAGGIWDRQDLTDYEVVEREPIVGRFQGMRVVGAPPPSSGGVALVQMLNMLAGEDLQALSDADRWHLLVEVMRRAYHDRARYLGDSDFVPVPVERLTDPNYAEGLRATLRMEQATPSDLFAGATADQGGRDTTHFSVMDRAGNRVGATLSINWPFGSGMVAAGTGVVLNNEMDDFAAQPGVPNAYGLVHSEANAIEPGKRMLSSMSPTFLEHEDRVAVLGTPGGSRIITMVLLAALEFHAGGRAEDMVALPRFHHQYLPDVIEHEPGVVPDDVRAELEARGHRFEDVGRTYGDMHVVIRGGDGSLTGAADPRGNGRVGLK